MENLDGMITKAREQVLNSHKLGETYATVKLAKIRIKEEALKLNYTDWYGMKELDGKHLLEVGEEEFIMILYKAILKRPATSEDTRIMLNAIHYEHAHRIDIMDAVQASEEAQQFDSVRIVGIDEERRKLNIKRKIKSIPVIGYIFRFCKSLVLLPRELAYLEERTDILGKQNSAYNLIRANVQDINEILRVNHISIREAEMEEQRKVYERKLVDRFYVQYNEELFVESRDVLKKRKAIYIEKFGQHFSTNDNSAISVVDLGCGTGEWLEVLQEAGYHAVGVDSNAEVVNKDHRLYPNLDVVQQDSIDFLRMQPKNSFDIITSFHMVEHMEIVEVMELCSEAARVLRPNGLLILETPNPLNILISSYYFYLDPTHKKPIPPELLEVYVHAGGLKVKERIFVNPLNFEPYEYKDDDPIKDIIFRFNMEQAYSIMAVKK